MKDAFLNIAFWIREHSLLSTLLAASILSLGWILFWLVVLFLSNWFLGSSTAIDAFMVAFWLSILAEAFIRYLENSRANAYFSKPREDNPQADNKDYTFSKALIICLTGFCILGGVIFLNSRGIIQISPPEENAPFFDGQSDKGLKAFDIMIGNWLNCLSDPRVYWTLIVGFIMRVVVYKRAHKLL